MKNYGKSTSIKNIEKLAEENHLLFQYLSEGRENLEYVPNIFENISGVDRHKPNS